ncbi:MAG: Glu/Leu/Phe/Val dehydrogenase dimerization domain-containing protein [Candidatus Thermoplasmatota archaeon]
MAKRKEIIAMNKHRNREGGHFEFRNDWDPKRVVHVYEPKLGVESILVIDNTALGPGCAGVRVSSAITPFKIFKLARATTLKCALADIPFGGAMAGIKANPNEVDKTSLIKSFAEEVSAYIPEECIVAPEMNTGAEEMAAFAEVIGKPYGVTGKPERVGGIPYELGVIGFGVGIAIETAPQVAPAIFDRKNIFESTVAMYGFNAIGSEIAKYLVSKRAKIVAISDFWGGCYNPESIDIRKALKHACATTEKKSIKNCKSGTPISKDELLRIDCDVLVFSSWENVISKYQASLIRAKCIVEGGNNLLTPDVEQILHKKGALVIPDILATAGGVIASYAECNGWNPNIAFSVIASKIEKNTKLVIQHALNSKLLPRSVCIEWAQNRVKKATEEKI